MFPIIRTAFSVGMVALAAACSAPTSVTGEWRDPVRSAGPMKSIVVIAQNVTPATRHSVEDRFAAELNARGTSAQPSYTAVGETLPSAEEVGAELRARGYEGVLIVRVGRGQEELSHATWPTMGPFTAAAQSEDYIVNTVVRSNASLWDLRDRKQVWSATTETTNPKSGDEVGKSLAKKILPALEKDGMVAAKR